MPDKGYPIGWTRSTGYQGTMWPVNMEMLGLMVDDSSSRWEPVESMSHGEWVRSSIAEEQRYTFSHADKAWYRAYEGF
jgi:hypothetical protein